METNRKILIGTDYSEAAGKAELYAIQLALKTGFTPVFLHVFEAPLAHLFVHGTRRIFFTPPTQLRGNTH